MEIRTPAVAGTFYPSHPKALHDQVESYCEPVREKLKPIAVVCPHAGFIYSGSVAGSIYSIVEVPPTVILIGPDHRGLGPGVSLMSEGIWKMPNGDVPIHSELAEEILGFSKFAKQDTRGHELEHSLEVQVPFLQYFQKEIRIVPITMKGRDYAYCQDLGNALACAIQKSSERVLIVASTDMSHYVTAETAATMDHKAIDKILEMNPKGLVDTVFKNGISMCGVIPTASVLVGAIQLGATSAQLIKYANSGDVSGDYQQVVGYAGLVIS